MTFKGHVTWANPAQYVDGTPYDHKKDGAGYEVAFDNDQAVVVLPFAYGNEFWLKDIAAYEVLPPGEHVVKLRVVTKGGEKSDWASAPFRKEPIPVPVSDLAVA